MHFPYDDYSEAITDVGSWPECCVMCNSQVPGMQVMEEEQSSTILTAAAEHPRGGIVTNEICQ